MDTYNKSNTDIISPLNQMGSDVHLSKVLSKFEMSKTHFSDIIIALVNSDNEYQGILHPLDVLRKHIDVSTSANSFLSKDIPILRENDPEIKDWIAIAKILINGNSRQIIVLDLKDRVLGAIRDIDVLKIVPQDETYLKNTIESILSPILGKSIFSDVSVGNAISIMRKQDLGYIVVVNRQTQKVDGIINSKTLVKYLYPKKGSVMDKIDVTKWTDLPAHNFVEETKIFASNTTVASIMKYMIENTANFCIIEDKKMFYLVEACDILQLFLKFHIKDDALIIIKKAPDELIKLQTLRKAQEIITQYTNLLGQAVTLKITFKQHKSQSGKGRYSTSVEVRLELLEKETITAEANEFGAEKAVNEALDRLVGILSEKRERYYDKVEKDSRKS